jgi:glycosyltransferase involved in cell wall biosynthesis
MMQMALQPMDKVIVVSNASKRWMIEEAMVKADKLDVIYPYSNMAGLAGLAEPRRESNEPLVIGAYGRFCDAKGFDRLIEAFKQTLASDNLRLVIGGFGADDAMLREAAAGCERISFVGKVTDVAGFLSQCHVVAIPSRYETYGQVANEARAAGRPILVSTAGGLPEQVGDGGIIVNCDAPDKLLAALRLLPIMPLDIMGRSGRLSTTNDRATRVHQWRQLLLQGVPKPASGTNGALRSAPALPQPCLKAATQSPL